MSYTVDPVRIFETKAGVSQLIGAPLNAIIGNNQVIYAGVTGKRIRVMGWRAHSNTAAIGSWVLKTSSGFAMGPVSWAPINTAPCDIQPIAECGYMETEIGDGLVVDVAASAVNFIFFIIVYTPGTV
jgi:hypothetical protein